MLKAHGKGIMEEEAQIQPKESAKGLYGYGQQGLARRYLLFPTQYMAEAAEENFVISPQPRIRMSKRKTQYTLKKPMEEYNRRIRKGRA